MGCGSRELPGVCATALVAWVVACGAGEEAPEHPAAPPAAPDAPREPDPPAPDPTTDPPPADRAAAAAREIFSNRCSVCHGAAGTGDGPGATGLDPAPRNLQDSGWQASVTDEYLQTIVLQGGAGVGKSPLMPPNPDLATQPQVVAALVEHIRGLAAN